MTALDGPDPLKGITASDWEAHKTTAIQEMYERSWATEPPMHDAEPFEIPSLPSPPSPPSRTARFSTPPRVPHHPDAVRANVMDHVKRTGANVVTEYRTVGDLEKIPNYVFHIVTAKSTSMRSDYEGTYLLIYRTNTADRIVAARLVTMLRIAPRVQSDTDDEMGELFVVLDVVEFLRTNRHRTIDYIARGLAAIADGPSLDDW